MESERRHAIGRISDPCLKPALCLFPWGSRARKKQSDLFFLSCPETTLRSWCCQWLCIEKCRKTDISACSSGHPLIQRLVGILLISIVFPDQHIARSGDDSTTETKHVSAGKAFCRKDFLLMTCHKVIYHCIKDRRT